MPCSIIFIGTIVRKIITINVIFATAELKLNRTCHLIGSMCPLTSFIFSAHNLCLESGPKKNTHSTYFVPNFKNVAKNSLTVYSF